MKHIHIAYILIALIISTCFYSTWQVYLIKEELLELANQLEAGILEKDLPKIRRDAENLYRYWHQSKDRLGRYVRHGAIDEITIAMAAIPELARYEMVPELSAELRKVQDILDHSWQSELPAWSNLF